MTPPWAGAHGGVINLAGLCQGGPKPVCQGGQLIHSQNLPPHGGREAAAGDHIRDAHLAQLPKHGRKAVCQGFSPQGEGGADCLEEERLPAVRGNGRRTARRAVYHGACHLGRGQKTGGWHVKKDLRLGVVLHVYRECAVVPSAGPCGQAQRHLPLDHHRDRRKAFCLHQSPQRRSGDVVGEVGAGQWDKARERLVYQGRDVQLENIPGDEGEVVHPGHRLPQHRQQGAVQLHGGHPPSHPAQLPGQAPDAGADFQYAMGAARAAGGGGLAGDPVLNQEILPHGFGEMEAVAAQQGPYLPDIA